MQATLTFKQYNKEQIFLSKRHQEKLARNRDIVFGGCFKVTKDEVMAELKRLNVDVHWDTILNWERAGLLPKSKMIGRNKDFPDTYPAEAVAVWQLKKGSMGLKNEQVKKARQIAIAAIEQKNEYPEITIERLITNAVVEHFRTEKGIDDLRPFRGLISSMEDYAVHWYWVCKNPEMFTELH